MNDDTSGDARAALSGLKNGLLFREKAYVGGAWTAGSDSATFAVRDPASGKTIAHVASLSAHDTEAAIAAAARAFPDWSQRTGKERVSVLRRWSNLITENMEDLCRILTLENGKPLSEAKGEYDYGLSILEWSIEDGKRIHGDVIPQTRRDQRLLAIRQPIGVCGAIIAWNFPAQLVLRKAAPALAAGCTLVLKPADLTPLSALALAELAEEAGLPPGVLNVVTGDAATIGQSLTKSEIVRKITFTGSTAVGKLLMQQSSSTVKRLSLELGGNAPFFVFEDADLEKAADALVASRFRNAGQTCVCANRVYVQDAVYDAFARAVVERVRKLKVGHGLDAGTTLGPLIDDRGSGKVARLVSDAVAKGAEAKIGGEGHALGGNFYMPTVLTEVTHAMSIAREEIFGPVLTLIRFQDEAEAIRYANDSVYGLAAYFFTEEPRRMWRFAEAVESGMVGVNTAMISNEVGPFGGVKQSGLGREGSQHGIEEFLETKYICIGDVS